MGEYTENSLKPQNLIEVLNILFWFSATLLGVSTTVFGIIKAGFYFNVDLLINLKTANVALNESLVNKINQSFEATPEILASLQTTAFTSSINLGASGLFIIFIKLKSSPRRQTIILSLLILLSVSVALSFYYLLIAIYSLGLII